MTETLEALLRRFDFDPAIVTAARAAARRVGDKERPSAADVKASVLRAFVDEGIDESDLAGTYGYGYDDAARRHYENLLARIFDAERALARLSLVSGTHAIVATLAALLDRGGRLVSATGRPYDTLRNAIVDAPYSLVARGARYEEVDLGGDGCVDRTALERSCSQGADVVFVQRSRGYSSRRSLSAAECGDVATVARAASPHALVVVDNCYGELVEPAEPTHYGVDVCAGSLIKNLGGGLAPGGGYAVGRARLIERIASYHYAPGIGAGVGPTLGHGRALIQGLFLAPFAVAESLAGLDFVAALFEEIGYPVDPAPAAPRYDIVQAIRLGSPERLLAFARGMQRALPVNARFAPEPGAVPGYAEPVVMSSGAFVAGSTLELSCDAPLRPPYEVYVQGGIVREAVVLGALYAAQTIGEGSDGALPAKGGL